MQARTHTHIDTDKSVYEVRSHVKLFKLIHIRLKKAIKTCQETHDTISLQHQEKLQVARTPPIN